MPIQQGLNTELDENGFAIIENVFNAEQIQSIDRIISSSQYCQENFVPSNHLFAIRELLLNIPELSGILFHDAIRDILSFLNDGKETFLSKALYFDKPASSNWFVAYHQDLAINVAEKHDVSGFKNWTQKRGVISTQPPIQYLENTITLRIHLDDTNEENGALRVLPASHKNGVVRVEDLDTTNEVLCNVNAGGVMLMKPLTFHASSKSKAEKRRRVIHLEFSTIELPKPLEWKERIN